MARPSRWGFCLLWALLPHGAALSSSYGQGAPARFGVRSDVVNAVGSSLHLGVAFDAPLGLYVRGGLVASHATARWRSSDVAKVRVDGVLSFHLDPFQEERRGLYGFAGVGAVRRRGEWSPVMVIGAGVEFYAGHRRSWSVEGGLGAGWRLGAIFRP